MLCPVKLLLPKGVFASLVFDFCFLTEFLMIVFLLNVTNFLQKDFVEE